MKRIIWFLGPPAVGKWTLMNEIFNDKEHILRGEFGIEGSIYLSRVSHEVRYEGRDDELEKDIRSGLDKADIIFVKHQNTDYTNGLVEKFKMKFPDAIQEIVFVNSDPDAIVKYSRVRGEKMKRGEENQYGKMDFRFWKEMSVEDVVKKQKKASDRIEDYKNKGFKVTLL